MLEKEVCDDQGDTGPKAGFSGLTTLAALGAIACLVVLVLRLQSEKKATKELEAKLAHKELEENSRKEKKSRTHSKAKKVNTDEQKYGSFAEIGASHDVARIFFQVGGASKTIGRSVSAYDKNVSKRYYGECKRVISSERVTSMMRTEYNLLQEYLAAEKGDKTTFFAFAYTLDCKSGDSGIGANGWVGIRFQAQPKSEPQEVVLHVRMPDKEIVEKQRAIGVLGVNLVHAALYDDAKDPRSFIKSLVEDLDKGRIEIDMIECKGPAFSHWDAKSIPMILLEEGLTDAVLYGPGAVMLEPSEVLYKKALLVDRASFARGGCPDVFKRAGADFDKDPRVVAGTKTPKKEALMEVSLGGSGMDHAGLLRRIEAFAAAPDAGFSVLVTTYTAHADLLTFFRQHTRLPVALVMDAEALTAVCAGKAGPDTELLGPAADPVRLYVPAACPPHAAPNGAAKIAPPPAAYARLVESGVVVSEF